MLLLTCPRLRPTRRDRVPLRRPGPRGLPGEPDVPHRTKNGPTTCSTVTTPKGTVRRALGPQRRLPPVVQRRCATRRQLRDRPREAVHESPAPRPRRQSPTHRQGGTQRSQQPASPSATPAPLPRKELAVPQNARIATGGRSDQLRRFTVDGAGVRRPPGRHRRVGAAGQRPDPRRRLALPSDRPRGIMAAGVEEPNALVQVGGRLPGADGRRVHAARHHRLLVDRPERQLPLGPGRPRPRRATRPTTTRCTSTPTSWSSAAVRRAWPRPVEAVRSRRPGHPARRPARARRRAALRFHADCEQIDGRAGPGLGRSAVEAELVAGRRSHRPEPHHGLRVLRRQLRHRRPEPHRPPRRPGSRSGVSRQRIWHIRAGQVVLATGAHERPLVFDEQRPPGHHARRRPCAATSTATPCAAGQTRGRQHHQRLAPTTLVDGPAAPPASRSPPSLDARAAACRRAAAAAVESRRPGRCIGSAVADTAAEDETGRMTRVDRPQHRRRRRAHLRASSSCACRPAGRLRWLEPGGAPPQPAARASCAGTTARQPSCPPTA